MTQQTFDLGRFAPPPHPQPSIYETTRVPLDPRVGSGYIDHHDIERIAARPAWSQEDAERRLRLPKGPGMSRRFPKKKRSAASLRPSPNHLQGRQ